MPDNFFAILNNEDVRKISLLQKTSADIRKLFVDNGKKLYSGREEIIFDGNYKVDDDEILYVPLKLTDNLKDVENNSIGIPILNLSIEYIKTLFWYENNEYYFQNFDKRKLLGNKQLLFYNNQTYETLKKEAFVVDDKIAAVYMDGKFLFSSYVNANKIFSLADYYAEATEEEVQVFCNHASLSIVDNAWFLKNSNTAIRKQISLIQKSNILDGADTKKIKLSAKKFKLNIELDDKKKIIFPCDKKICRQLLTFLNEQYYVGLITGIHYKTNSKKLV